MRGGDAYADPGWEAIVRDIVAAHQSVEGAILPVLEQVQARFGYISEGALDLVADGLHLTPPQVYAVATYYHEFRVGSQAAHHLAICRGPACRVSGGAALLRRARALLGIEVGESTPDGQLALETSGCLGVCPHAPALKLDHEVLGRVTPDALAAILEGGAR